MFSLLVSAIVLPGLGLPTACFPKARLAGVTVTATTPEPVKLTVCGLLLALSVNVSVPGRLPVVVGLSVTPTVQALRAGTDVPQVLLIKA
jgi:hypothetical protein